MLVLSDFSIDDSRNLEKLENLLIQLELGQKVPGLFIICGQFILDKNIRNQEDMDNMMNKFKEFKAILTRYKKIVEQVQMALVPDFNDPWINTLPRKPLPENLISDILESFPTIMAVENPCNISFMVSKAMFVV